MKRYQIPHLGLARCVLDANTLDKSCIPVWVCHQDAMEIVSSPKHELVECPLKTLLTGGLPDKAALQTTLGGLVGLSWNLLYRPVSGTMAKACIP